jgi:hypothetical protein
VLRLPPDDVDARLPGRHWFLTEGGT